MNDIKVDLLKLFQNEKVVEIFRVSDGGQGMINLEIERRFSFSEIDELYEICLTQLPQNLISKYENYPNIEMFIMSFQDKIDELSKFYRHTGSIDFAVDFVKNHPNEVVKKFPNQNKNESYKSFVLAYQEKHRALSENTYEQVKDFFENPLAWL